jgi:AraC-like DNA-binding protein
MPVAPHQQGLARRRTVVQAQYGAAVPAVTADSDDLIFLDHEPEPWCTQSLGPARVFRGRLMPGAAVLPPRLDRGGTTVGLASRPIVIRSAGVAHPIAAGVPWVVSARSGWRLGIDQMTDLTVLSITANAAQRAFEGLSQDRPTRFSVREAPIVRAALKAAAPVWIDSSARPIYDLAGRRPGNWRLVGGRTPSAVDREGLVVTLEMLAWAIEQTGTHQDPRFTAVVRHLNEHLGDPDLSSTSVADRLRVSRRALQRLFEPHGGMTAYLRRLRLAAVLDQLAATDQDPPDVDEIAANAGLGSRRTLERAMRAVYGMTPGQARAHLLSGQPMRALRLVETAV